MTDLRNSTAATVMIGPFVDVNGAALTALTIAAADIRLQKHNAAGFVNKNSGGATHVEGGFYSIDLDTTDTNGIGRLMGHVNATGAIPLAFSFMVLPTAQYDWEYGSGTLQGQTASTPIHSGTATAGSANTLTLAAGASAVTDAYRGSLLETSVSTPRYITAYNGTTKVATVDRAFDAVPTTPTYSVTKFGPDIGSVTAIQTGLATSAELTAAVAPLATSAALTTVGNYVDTEVAAILAAVDTEVSAIKAKTDQLIFTKANELDANIQSVNGVTVVGNGAGTPWGP
jgi:hypothetical protein